MPVRLALGLHNHQPVGNFGFVFEQAYRDAYLPFLELMERYDALPFTLHTSGPLMEWLVAERPDYVDRLRRLVLRGRVELLGGAFYEPILPSIPHRDRVGQICTYTSYLEALFGCKVRGMWLAERVWEPELTTDLVRSGIEYTLLDDYHFKQAGAADEQLLGYHLTEDEGRLLKVFPISERMRYLVPWKEPAAALAYLRELSESHPDAVVVCADDGEKFGGWPETHTHCYTNGWLETFFELLMENRDWLRFVTLAQALDETPPAGLIYLPDCSYREMTEWALPTPRLRAYQEVVRELEARPEMKGVKGFLRGGFWRNVRVKYPEAQEMYARMIEVSEKVRAWESESAAARLRAPGSELEAAPAIELYRAQCNCAYWHGAFGGLYLPHLRNSVYHHLLAAENALLQLGVRTLPRVDAEVRDFNLNGFAEIRLSNWRQYVYLDPRQGGCIYELDLPAINHNLLATLSRRPEAYHDVVRRAAGVSEDSAEWKALHEQVKFKQPNLDGQLIYDSYDRKSLIDHFFDADTTLTKVAGNRAVERGDCVAAAYVMEVSKQREALTATLTRNATVFDHSLRVRKEVSLKAESDTIEIRYVLEDLPRACPTRFAVEFQFAGLAANADDRYYTYPGKAKAGQLQTQHDLAATDRFGLVDEWLGLTATLVFAHPAGIWAFPIQSVSQSEGGFELVHQSCAVFAHWLLDGTAERWETTISLRLVTK